MSPRSARMCHELGVTRAVMKIMAVSVVEWGWYTYRVFNRCMAASWN